MPEGEHRGLSDVVENVEITTHSIEEGERLEAYLTQPFYVTESFTKKQGESVSLQDTLNDVKEIINGAIDSKVVSEVAFIGKL